MRHNPILTVSEKTGFPHQCFSRSSEEFRIIIASRSIGALILAKLTSQYIFHCNSNP